MSNPKPRKGAILIGPLSPSGTGKHAPMPQYDFDIPERITNASSSEPYIPNDKTVYRNRRRACWR